MSTEDQTVSWLRAVGRGLRALLYLAALISLLGFAGDSWLLFELTTHFRPHMLIVLGVGALWLLALRRWRSFWPVVLVALLNAGVVLPWFIGRDENPPAANTTQVRLFLANVHTANREHHWVLEQIAREDPDIVILQETDMHWVTALRVLEERYPHNLQVARSDNFGIALYSRLPLADLHVVNFGSSNVPSIVGTLQSGGENVTLIATHPVPPIGLMYFRWRNDQLRAVASFAAKQPRSIVIGDLNVTMWSPYHASFVQQSGLHNVRRGHGVLATWPVGFGPLMIPLDHCLVSPDIGVGELHVGQPTGGDHLPLVVELVL